MSSRGGQHGGRDQRQTNRPVLPMLLSFNAGYVDTAGSPCPSVDCSTAHVTGNFVNARRIVWRSVHRAPLAKLLALPVFCLIVILSRPSVVPAEKLGSLPVFRSLLAIKLVLLTAVGDPADPPRAVCGWKTAGPPLSPAWSWFRPWRCRMPLIASTFPARRRRR